MPQTSHPPPPPPSGGNLKYFVIGLLFLAGAIAVFVAGREPPAPPSVSEVPLAAEPARANPLATQELVLDEEPAPQPEPETVTHKGGGGVRPRGDEWACSGDLAGATAIINENRTQIRSCYERRLKINNFLQGDIRLKLKVDSGGKVTATATSGSLHDPEVLNCMRSLARSWTFGVPTGGSCAVLQIPFRFAPKAP